METKTVMKDRISKIPFLKINLISFAVFIFPFIYYYISKITGNLPDPEGWFRATNHGPWRWEFPGMFIIFPFQILIPITIFFGIKNTIVSKRLTILLFMLATLTLQVIYAAAQAKWLFWTID